MGHRRPEGKRSVVDRTQEKGAPLAPGAPFVRSRVGARYFTLTAMVRALASSRLGSFTVSTPCS
jgi:hypothetical protein